MINFTKKLCSVHLCIPEFKKKHCCSDSCRSHPYFPVVIPIQYKRRTSLNWIISTQRALKAENMKHAGGTSKKIFFKRFLSFTALPFLMWPFCQLKVQRASLNFLSRQWNAILSMWGQKSGKMGQHIFFQLNLMYELQQSKFFKINF